MKAAASCNFGAVEMLLRFSGDPFFRNSLGKDVFSFARASDIKLLLQNYCDTLIED